MTGAIYQQGCWGGGGGGGGGSVCVVESCSTEKKAALLPWLAARLEGSQPPSARLPEKGAWPRGRLQTQVAFGGGGGGG